MIPRAVWFYLGAFYLGFQALATMLWWTILFVEPRSRPLFRPANAPDSVLFAFLLPDAILFVGAGIWSAILLIQKPRSARFPLALHSGAAVYAALFCVGQYIASGEAALAALLMAPCLIVEPLLLWKLARS